jgi:UDP-N-acetylglucosamine 2-epimerase (non-hydrolysing)
MKLAIILGTRPEIIKMSPVIRDCQKRKLDFFILHTGQHYSPNMDSIFFEELHLPAPKYNLNIGSGAHGQQTGRMLEKIEAIFVSEKPDVVLVEGDTNTVLAGALAASKLYIKIGHVESGLRSYDRQMPEETNRVMTDHISDYLFAPTDLAKKNLIAEGLPKNKIFVVGNTVVDAVQENLAYANKEIINNLKLEKKKYFLLTVHRQENVDSFERLKNILIGIGKVYDKYKLEIIYPIHPRSRKMIQEHKLKLPEGVRLVEPIGYLDFLELEKNAALILTDSGGVQEEACILQIPCVTLRYNTERPETISVGANVLAGTEPKKIVQCAEKMLKSKLKKKNPFGDGKSAQRIIDIVLGK